MLDANLSYGAAMAEPPVIVTARKPRRAPRSKPKTEIPSMPRRIVTAHKRGVWRVGVSDLSPEDAQRRGDAADELFRELVRRVIAGKKRREQVR